MNTPRPFRTDGLVGWNVEHVPVTGSTNTDLLEAAASGVPSRTVRRAGHQTAGRGRLDRRWDAPPESNLLVSFLFRDGDPAGPPLVLMRRLGLAIVDAVAVAAGVEARLKWPNDVLVGGAKLAGLLAQGGPGVTVIGCGVNVGWAPERAARVGDTVTPAELLDAVLVAFDARGEQRPDQVHAAYVDALATLGQHVRIELPGERQLLGRATGVEPDGRLVVLDECAITHRVDVGDVIHLRPA